MWALLMIIINVTASALSVTTIINGINNLCTEDIVFGSTLLLINLFCLSVNINRVIDEENK